jgi:hypothetical protein
MKTYRLLARLSEFLGSDSQAQRRERRAILEIMGKLRAKERKFQQRLEETTEPEERESLEGRLRVVRAQRRKGVERLLELRRRQHRGGDVETGVRDAR